jgi:arginase family enzyme
MIGRTIHILGVPLRSGSLMPGTENDAPRYREAGLLQRLTASGCRAIDEGDLAIPSYLPHHTVPPLRNWPGPRIVWDLLADRIPPWLGEAGHLPLLIGCDCSVVAGTVQAFNAAADDLHVLYIDGDFDDAPPDPQVCQSAAAMAVWLITNQSPFRSGPALRPSQVTVLGWSKPSRSPGSAGRSISLQDVRRIGPPKVVQDLLASLPASSNILVHFDIDVLADNEFPAAYFPHAEGLTMAEMAELLLPLLRDPRVRLVEVSEYSALRDMNRVWIEKLVGILSAALSGGENVGAAALR